MPGSKYIPALRFDALTSFYDPVVRLTTRESSFKRALIEEAHLKPGFQILDLGSGTGTLALMIKEVCPDVTVFGIDSDLRIIETAQNKARNVQQKIGLVGGMSYALPFGDKIFDRVFSSLFFHHLTRENKIKTFYEVRRILKPDGEIHIADWGLPDGRLMKISSRLIKLLDGEESTSDNHEGRLTSMLSESGFRGLKEPARFNTVFGTIRLLNARI